jgi:hexosaminidase
MKSSLVRSLSCFLLAGTLCVASRYLSAQTPQPLPIMPLPAHAVSGEGQFLVDSSFNITFTGYTEPRLDRARQRFIDTLSKETGIPLWRLAQFNTAHFIVDTKGPSLPIEQLGEDESYKLEITPTEVHLTAPNPLGVLHGMQTFLQLVHTTPQGFSAPVVTIDDQPRFPWRGLMLDVSRHFMPISMVERTLDGMEAVKLNVMHWHLSDDQGFRVESKALPLLQKDGSDGLYYTQDQIREIIGYARDRGIRVIPEFDMPCHTASWMVGYPQLSSGPGPHEISRKMGVQNAAMDPTKDSTYKFVDTFIGEMSGLFPDAYFHIGGDECNGKEWASNPQIQAYMHAHNIATKEALQAGFTARVQKIVAKHHKIMEGWDEVLQPGTPKDVVIQSWRGQASLAQAARQGNRGILSTGYYIDLNQPASYHYSVDPLGGDAASLDPEQKARILGGEAAMWSEFVDPENVDRRIWPRTAAIAERLWSPQDVTDVRSMYQRLDIVAQKLEYYGIDPAATTNIMLQRMTGNPHPTALDVLAATVQPPMGYSRKIANFTTFTPLNRLVDAVPSESRVAREFSDLAKEIASGQASPQQIDHARQCLILWRDNDARLQPTLAQSSITKELIPVSHTLNQVATIGLDALQHLNSQTSLSADARQNDLQSLKAAEAQQANVVNMIAPAVEILVQATKTE